jgi:L-ascorbate peroxidase
LHFDNSYFHRYDAAKRSAADNEQLLWLPTDEILYQDAGFKPHFEAYAQSNDKFLADYGLAHAKLSELGSKFEPEQGIQID